MVQLGEVVAIAKPNQLTLTLKTKQPMMIFTIRVLSASRERSFYGPYQRQLLIIKILGFNQSLRKHHQMMKILVGSEEGFNLLRTVTESNRESRKQGVWTREEARVFTMAREKSQRELRGPRGLDKNMKMVICKKGVEKKKNGHLGSSLITSMLTQQNRQ